MDNKTIASKFNLLANLMTLHGENPFKIRSYSNAYQTIRKLDRDLNSMSDDELSSIKGFGKAIVEKIHSMLETGSFATLDRFVEQTPPGIIEILSIRGIGPKAVATFWKDLGIETPGELLQACEENRLVELKGFGEKKQNEIKQKLEFYFSSKGQALYRNIENDAENILSELQSAFPDDKFDFVGDFKLKIPVVELLTIGTSLNDIPDSILEQSQHIEFVDGDYRCQGVLVNVESGLAPDQFDQNIYTLTMGGGDVHNANLPPELWDYTLIDSKLTPSDLVDALLDEESIKGVIHNHTTYSDGLYSLEEMVTYAQELGYSYMAITDHSKAAFYANGLSEERVYQQFAEIDDLNSKMQNFRILKGIECDILADGSMDYSDEVLQDFDLVIASIHSNLKMDEKKATGRLIKAIEHPNVHMLGHPTSRLLLSRAGYPIDHKKVIEACAANQVSIEINANPLRLDIDYKWLPMAREKGILISINPDAHNKQGIHHIKYGVIVARKGGLQTSECLNAYDVDGFLERLKK